MLPLQPLGERFERSQALGISGCALAREREHRPSEHPVESELLGGGVCERLNVSLERCSVGPRHRPSERLWQAELFEIVQDTAQERQEMAHRSRPLETGCPAEELSRRPHQRDEPVGGDRRCGMVERPLGRIERERLGTELPGQPDEFVGERWIRVDRDPHALPGCWIGCTSEGLERVERSRLGAGAGSWCE